MKNLATLILLFCACITHAQNWNCVDPGIKRYFTNDVGYLKGIRIDSSATIPNGLYLKPFKTVWSQGSVLDIHGGSWIGKSIKILNDGTHYFENFLGDTAVIKAQAKKGDTWTFYNDVAAIHFEATVLSEDTMTILGAIDSIKRISVIGKDAANATVTDPMNYRIIISKEHGFVTVFPLYQFPFRQPNQAFGNGMDYYFFELRQNGFADEQVYHFNLIDFYNATRREIFDYQPGDIMQVSNPAYPWFSSLQYFSDTIIGRSDINGFITYQFKNRTWLKFYDYYIGGSSCMTGDAFDPIDSTPIVPHHFFPEEAPNVYSLYYWPKDTSFCKVSDLYEIQYNTLTIEMMFNRYRYKRGVGKTLESVHCHSGGSDGRKVIFCKINGIDCGTAVGINGIDKNSNSIKLFPNPATTAVNLERAATFPCTISIFDAIGAKKYFNTWTGTQLSISTESFPPGVYNVQLISATDVAAYKLVIQK